MPIPFLYDPVKSCLVRLSSILAFLSLAAIAGCRAGGPTADVGPLEKLNAEPGGFTRSSLIYSAALSATANGRAVAAWMRGVGKFQPVVYRRTGDANGSFGPEAFLSPETLRDTISTVPALQSGTQAAQLYAMWQARRPTSGDKFVVFRESGDAGATWSEGVALNTQPSAFLPAMAMDRDGAIYVVWIDERERGLRVFFNRSLDHGRTWLPSDVRIDGILYRSAGAVSVSVASDGAGRVLAVWEERGGGGRSIQATASQDRGTTWGLPMRVDDATSRLSPLSPSAVFASGRAIVAWTAASGGSRTIGQVWGDVSSDGGLTWATDVLVHQVEGGVAPRLHLVSDGSKARMAFHAGRRSVTGIYYAESDANGAWPTGDARVRRVSAPETRCTSPRLAVDAFGAVYVTYEEDDRRIGLVRSANGGVTWDAPNLVYEVPPAELSATAHLPQVAVADGPAYVMWEVWTDAPEDKPKTLAEADKPRPADLYVRRVTFPPASSGR